MLLFCIIFLCGCIVGAVIAIIFWHFTFKQRFSNTLLTLDADKKYLSETLKKAQDDVRNFSERASIASYLKDDLEGTRSLLEQKQKEIALLSERNASLLVEKEKSVEFLNHRIKDLLAVH